MTSASPDHLRPIVGDMSDPVDDQGQFIDSGRRREIGVTHWHLNRTARVGNVGPDPVRHRAGQG
jgi:hypothetical protein